MHKYQAIAIHFLGNSRDGLRNVITASIAGTSQWTVISLYDAHEGLPGVGKGEAGEEEEGEN